MTKLWVSGTAKFSEDKKHRFLLTREFHAGLATALFIGLNPSTATEEVDDPTVRRCIGFSIQWGYRRLEVANAFSLRSTDPKALYSSASPTVPENDVEIREAAKRAAIIVAAWGSHGEFQDRGRAVMALLQGMKVHCLGETKDGFPRHPLYLASATSLQVYRLSA